MLDQIKGDTEELLKLAFENYYLLSSNARKGILDGSCSPPPGPNEFPPTALVAGVHLFEAMRDVFHPRDVEWLTDRFKLAAKGRWQRLAMLCDEEGLQVGGGPLGCGQQQRDTWMGLRMHFTFFRKLPPALLTLLLTLHSASKACGLILFTHCPCTCLRMQ